MRVLLVWLMMCLSIVAHATVPNFDDIAAEEDYLEVEQAFKPVLTVQDEHILLSFTVADGYYLYKKRIFVNAADQTPIAMGQISFKQTPHLKNDPNFGRVEIFDKSLNVDMPVYATQNSDVGREVAVNASYQGCSAQGLCYPPQNIQTTVKLLRVAAAVPVENLETPLSNNKVLADAEDANSLSQFLAGSSLWLILATFLVLGIGLSFTPCVLPMVPILSGIIAGQGQGLSAKRGFLLSLSYVVGMATTYALAGMAVGYFGASANLSAWMQSPVVLSVFAAIFVLLALAMFGFYELRLPAFIQDRLSNLNQKQQGGTYIGVLLMGILSALVVSP
ncbi:MAG: hypothetical protein KDI39_17895, partial [Pseudomonadales bacterium]|nr:hypothetical protein [Pseudomonadales bacterium]